MARQPTGRPRGRPHGSGKLGEQMRLTVRIPKDLIDRLEAFAAGRHYFRGAPQMADCVREAIEHYLSCPHKRQTIIKTQPSDDILRQTENTDIDHGTLNRQTKNIPAIGEEDKRQTENIPAVPLAEIRQTETVLQPKIMNDENISSATKSVEPLSDPVTADVPDFDPATRVLGKLCPRGHDYNGSGQSLLRRANLGCLKCEAEKGREKRRRRKAPAPAQ